MNIPSADVETITEWRNAIDLFPSKQVTNIPPRFHPNSKIEECEELASIPNYHRWSKKCDSGGIGLKEENKLTCGGMENHTHYFNVN